MKDFKGTQGPWEFDDINFKIKGVGDIEGMTVIANVSPKMDYSRGRNTQICNAILIAESPTMLDFLNEFVTAIENEEIIIKENFDNDGYEDCSGRLYTKAQSILEKILRS